MMEAFEQESGTDANMATNHDNWYCVIKRNGRRNIKKVKNKKQLQSKQIDGELQVHKDATLDDKVDVSGETDLSGLTEDKTKDKICATDDCTLDVSIVGIDNELYRPLVLTKACLKCGILLEGLIAEASVSVADISQLFLDGKDKLQKQMMAAHTYGDVHTVVSIVRRWSKSLRSSSKGDSNSWCEERGFNSTHLAAIETKVQELYDELQSDIAPKKAPSLNFLANYKRSDGLLLEALCEVFGKNICVFKGHEKLGYTKLHNGNSLNINEASILQAFWRKPDYIVPIKADKADMYMALPEQHAAELSLTVARKTLEEIKKCSIAKRSNIQNVGSKVRTKIVDHLHRHTDSAKALITKLVQGGVQDPQNTIYVEKDATHFGLDIYALESDLSTVKLCIEDMIKDERKAMKDQAFEINYPHKENHFRIQIGEGLTAKQVLFHGEHVRIGVKCVAGHTLQLSDIQNATSSMDGIENITMMDADSETDFHAIINVENPEAALKILSETRNEEHFTTGPISKGEATCYDSLVKISSDTTFRLVWKVHTDRFRKARVRDEDLTLVRAALYRLLGYIEEDRLDIIVNKKDGDTKNAHCTIKCKDHILAARVLKCLQEAETNGAPLQLQNIEEVHRDLSRLQFSIDNRVFEVMQHVLQAKLDNFSYSKSYKFQHIGLEDSHDCKVLRVVLEEPSQMILNAVSDRLCSCLQPKLHSLTKAFHTYLQTPKGQLLLELVMEETKTFIHLPPFTSEVHIYGRGKATADASKMLAEFNENRSHSYWHQLQPHATLPYDLNCRLLKQFGGCVAGAEFGCKNDKVKEVRFRAQQKDIVYLAPHTSDFNGTLRGFIKKEYGFVKDIPVDQFPSCGVCGVDCTSVESCLDMYIVESCGCCYCRYCLRTQLNVAERNTLLPVLCGADDTPFAVQDLLNISGWFHSKLHIHTMIGAALRQFVNNHADAMRFCGKPDCPGVYRVGSEKSKVTLCSVCSLKLCPLCMEQYHGLLTCKEYKESSQVVHHWMKENPKMRKQCPKCKMGIEKIDGCNNVYCLFCKHNLCWVCLKSFTNSNHCYDHLDAVHGGCYDRN